MHFPLRSTTLQSGCGIDSASTAIIVDMMQELRSKRGLNNLGLTAVSRQWRGALAI